MTNRELQFLDCMKKLCRSTEEIEAVRCKIEKRPEKLYRYRRLGTSEQLGYVLNEIKNGEIFMQVNSKLNDPMDMFFNISRLDMGYMFNLATKNFNFDFLKQEGLNELEIEKVRNSDMPFQEIMQILQIKGSKLDFEELFSSELTDNLCKNINSMYETVKVACFTDTYTNLSMWYNYANNYSGVCFEYDKFNTEVSDEPLPVIYADNMPNVNNLLIPEVYNLEANADSDFENVISLFQQMIYFKTNDWKYEGEWRLCNKLTPESFGFEEFEEEKERRELAIETYCENHPSARLACLLGNMPSELLQELYMIYVEYNDKRMENFLAKPKEGSPAYIGRPSKIYLGDKIFDVDREIIVMVADSLNIPVDVMKVADDGYRPVKYQDFLVEHDTKKAEELAKQAKEHNDKREFEKALRICEKSNGLTTHKCSKLYYNYFKSLFCLEQYEKALDVINRAIETFPNDPNLLNNAGATLRALKCFPAAIEKYNTAIEMYPLIPLVHINLAICYIHIGEYDKAIETLHNSKSKRFLHEHKNFDDELRTHADFNETLKQFPDFKEQLKQHPDLYVWDE